MASVLPIVTASSMFTILDDAWTRRVNVYFHGPSGIGKSQVNEQWARMKAESLDLTFATLSDGAPKDWEKTFCLIDLRAVLLDVLDVKGAPFLDKEAEVTRFLVSDLLPNVMKHGKQGVLFLDELPQAAPMVSNGLSQLIYDKRVGANYLFPEGWIIVAAGNRKQDGAATNKVGAQIYNRFANYEMVADIGAFAKYLLAKGGDPRVPNFLRLREELLHQYHKGDVVFPTPRKWEEADEIVRTILDKDLRELLVGGEVGAGPAAELEGYLEMCTQIVTWKQVTSDPLGAKMPEIGTDGAVAATFATIGMLVNNVTEDTIDAVFAYAKRLPPEFTMLMAGDIIARKPELGETMAFSQWRSDNPETAV